MTKLSTIANTKSTHRRPVRIALAGCGNRARRYAAYISDMQMAVVTAIADPEATRRDRMIESCRLSAVEVFDNAADMINRGAGSLFDAVIIATPERSHYSLSLLALNRGLDILIEKPIAVKAEECIDIAATALRLERTAGVCHVLRYHPFYKTLYNVIQSHTSGTIVMINHLVNVGIDRAIHTFVRSPWGNSSETSQIMLSKCCHDLDLLLWLTGAALPCKVSSAGSRAWFTANNAPNQCTLRCIDCPIEPICHYSAVDMYRRRGVWTDNFDHLPGESHQQAIERYLQSTRYGQCVFRMSNNVADRQIMSVEFSDGMLFSISLRLFTSDDYRKTIITFTDGELEADQRQIIFTPLRGKPQIIDLTDTVTDTEGHSGADCAVISDFIEALTRPDHQMLSSVRNAVDSHLICLAAERSREVGQIIPLPNYDFS